MNFYYEGFGNERISFFFKLFTLPEHQKKHSIWVEKQKVRFSEKTCYTNCYSKCRIANFEFTMVNADRLIKRQIEQPVPIKSGK